jgi:hypothetical protein
LFSWQIPKETFGGSPTDVGVFFPLFLLSFLCVRVWLQVLEESLESAKQLVSVSSISRHTQRNRAQPLSPTWLTHKPP